MVSAAIYSSRILFVLSGTTFINKYIYEAYKVFILELSIVLQGSISVSMSIDQTFFCFICSHLTSGEKDGDELRRNVDVQEIHRRTLFTSASSKELPRVIYDHE